MKKIDSESAFMHFSLLLLIFIFIFFCSVMFGQDRKYVKIGNQFSVKTEKTQDINTGYTFKDKAGKVYPIYQNSKGNFYIVRKSRKTGKEYKAALPKEICTEIAKELN